MINFSSRLFPLNPIMKNIWLVGIPLCLFGVIARAIANFADNYVSYLEFFYFLMAVLLLIGWMALKLPFKEELDTTQKVEIGQLNSSLYRNKTHALATHKRLLELKQYHIISQLHILPFPYLSQIYHLLNLKHLETVHSNSLGGLKVLDVYDFQPTDLGGTIKFRTTVDSPINILKLWRQAIADVELTLHGPYMVELSIPIYNGKKMIVMFNVFPLSHNTHELLIDIYTDLQFPKFFLWFVLHLAALVTLYEDLPYLKKLSERDLTRSLNPFKGTSGHKTMWLFQRFLNLHAASNPVSHVLSQATLSSEAC